jgi:trimeric autotransporter adhesin
MASTKQLADKQKEKEKKEKIVLAVLVLILIVVGAVMIPGMLKKKGTTAVATSPTSQTTSTSPVVPSSGTPSSGGTPSASGVSASGSPGAATFPNASTYQPGEGQLSGFGRLASNEPFGNIPVAGTNGSTGTTSTSTTSTFASAVISINGASSTVPLHGAFPAASKAFILDSITAGSIKVSVTNGSFSGGRSLITIRKSHTVVLENTVDGTRYALKMISAASSGGTPGGTTTSVGTSVGTTTSTGP